MEILSPQLMWIAGRCYRVNPTSEAHSAAASPVDDNDVDESVPEPTPAPAAAEPYIEKGIVEETSNAN